MIAYLLKMTICALLLLAVYTLFLEKEKMHCFKRFYLLFSLIFSLGIPFVTIEVAKTSILTEALPFTEVQVVASPDVEVVEGAYVVPSESEAIDTSYLILLAYAAVAAILALRFTINMVRLMKSAKRNERISLNGFKIVLTDINHIPYSFGNYIFFNKNEYNDKQIEGEVLAHEIAHVKQHHSMDILFIELLLIIFWFNPVLYLYRSKIKLNHEFLADEGVLSAYNDIPHYQMILIDKISRQNSLSLTSGFNYLLTKKRLTMMTKTTSKSSASCKKILSVLLVFIAVYVFSGKIIAGDIDKSIMLQEKSINEDIILNKGVSQEKINEYKSIVNKYLEKEDESTVTWNGKFLSESDFWNLYVIYLQMTDSQRKELLINFRSPLVNVYRERRPNITEWNICKNSNNKYIWVDGKQKTTEEMKLYKRSDFVFFLMKRPIKNEKGIQSFLWTKKGLEEYQNQYKERIAITEVYKVPPHVLWKVSKGPKLQMSKQQD